MAKSAAPRLTLTSSAGFTSEAHRRFLANHELVCRALCQTLAGHPDPGDWPALSSTDRTLLVATARAEGVAPRLCRSLEVAGRPETR